MSQTPTSKRSKWSSEETCLLINEYRRCRGAPVYRRRRRARSSRALVRVDWRAVASAVTCRTPLQCKTRMKRLKRQYVKGLYKDLPFYSLLHAVLADEVGDRSAGAVEGGGTPAGSAADEGGSTANKGTMVLDHVVPSEDERDIAMVDAPTAPAVIEGAPVAGDAGGTASVDCRAAAAALNSCRTSDDIQCRGRVKLLSVIYDKKHDAVGEVAEGEECSGVETDASGADAEAARRRATCVPPPILKTPRNAATKLASSANSMAMDDEDSEPVDPILPNQSAEAPAPGSADAQVIIKLAEEVTKLAEEATKQVTMLGGIYKDLGAMYKDLRTKELDLDVEREKAHAGAGRRA